MPEARVRERLNTVREVVRAYLVRTESNQGVKTFHDRRVLLLAFVASYGDMPITDLIPDDLEGWIEAHPDWKSDWTIMRVAQTVKRPFAWAWRKGLIERLPFASVSYPPGPRGKPVESGHFLGFVRATDGWFRRVLVFMSITGARPCEIAALEWSFIDPIQGTATLHTHKTSRTRKDRAPRVIYLTELAVRLLLWIKRHQAQGERFVFLTSHKKPWKTGGLDMRVWHLRERLGIPRSVRLYGCRHAWATKLAIGGVDLATLAVLLGHTTVAMASYYVHLAGRTQYLREVLERGLKR